jgi:hypothetical protein
LVNIKEVDHLRNLRIGGRFSTKLVIQEKGYEGLEYIDLLQDKQTC